MFNFLWQKILSFKSKLPFTYSIILIILVPLTLVFNTWWNLRAFERDMNFAVREQALTLEKSFHILTKDKSLSQENILTALNQLKEAEPKLIAGSVLVYDPTNGFKILATTNQQSAQLDKELFLNQLAWGENQSYFTLAYDQNYQKNLWLLITPFYDHQKQKIGLLSLKVSSEAVDVVMSRTSRDALIILVLSVIVIILLLLNHLKFFERSLLVDKLKQIDQMKDDFISVASHELRAPLTAIKSGISLIKEDLGEKIPDSIKEWLSILDQSTSRLSDLVEELLNISRIEQNRLDFSLSPVDVCKIIEEAVNQFKFTAAEKGLNLNFNNKSDTGQSIHALANSDRLKEILINLVNNAIKYTPKGSVSIETISSDHQIKILVKDTGIGIAPENKEKLFQKFSRIQDDTTKNIPGTGLGLWITKAMIEKMQGKIYVDSILGQGTVFTVVFKPALPNGRQA